MPNEFILVFSAAMKNNSSIKPNVVKKNHQNRLGIVAFIVDYEQHIPGTAECGCVKETWLGKKRRS